VTDYDPYTKKQDAAYPQTRWIPVLRNDFAARADWCVKSYQEATHPPTVRLNQTHDIRVKAGQRVPLSGPATNSDGNPVSYRW
jgi:hypothetical protein